MTIYYSLTFFLLAAEMLTFCIICVPLPFTVRKKIVTFLAGNYVVAKIAYGVKIAFIFVGVLFVDAVQRMFRITAEAEASKQGGPNMVHDVRAENSFAARKFYAQRNTYLTGFALFLSLVLTRTFYILLELVHAQDEYAKLKKEVAGQSRDKLANDGDQAKQIEELKKKLATAEARARDFDILKKQSEQQAKEYDRLATEYNNATGATSDKRKD